MATVREIHGGWGAFTFLLDDDHILRFARDASVVSAHRNEAALLPKLAAAVSFHVPEPDFFGAWDTGSCIGYPFIPGRPLTAADGWLALAGMLRELHGFPVDVARDTLGVAGTVAEWRGSREQVWADACERALPVLDEDLRTALTTEYTTFQAADPDFSPTLVHGDLAPEHVLVDDGDGRVVGLIDFEDATVGDPAVDFAGLLPLLGPARIERLVAAYGRPVDPARLRFYWRFAPVYDLLHGIDTGEQAITTAAVERLRARLT
jgi:aminoglycoside 2''-phosphotransferase